MRLPSVLLNTTNSQLGWRGYVLLLLLALACFAPGIASLPVTDRDEPRFAQASKQMIESGNYVDIRYQDEVRYKKPVGIYWLQSASARLFNPDNLNQIWAYRLPSLLGAVLAVLFTAALGCLMFGPLAGFMAGLLLLSTLILNVEARIAKTDAMLLGCIMAAQYALARAYVAHIRHTAMPGWGNALLFWTAQAIAFLIKGPILLLVTVSTIIVGYFWRPKHSAAVGMSWLKALRPLVGLPYALLLIMPWFVAIMSLSGGNFAKESAGHDLLSKLWQGQDRGIVPPGVHLLAFPAVYFPAALIVLLALPDIWRNRHDQLVKFLLAWIIPTWLVFELALTKLPHYTLPAFPALAILAAKFCVDGFPKLGIDGKRRLPFFAATIMVILSLGLAIGTFVLRFSHGGGYDPVTLAAALILIMGMGLSLALIAQKKPLGIAALAATALVFFVTTLAHTLPHLMNFWHARDVTTVALAAKPCPELKLVSSDYAEPSLVFQAGTATQLSPGGQAVATAMQADHCVLGLVSAKQLAAFQQAWGNAPPPETIQNFKGYNLGSGRIVDLTLYRMAASQ
jgi:hypothetical protein